MDGATPKPTIENILEDCPRSRVLVVGKSGVGKSSLINYAFNVDIANVSHNEHGVCDINTEIISEYNSYFVLHDSQGFEPNEVDNLEKVKNFVQLRNEASHLKDRVHAIWLCVQIPFAGGRVFETGDEEFLKFLKSLAQVPIVIVFTQFDRLVSRMEEHLSDEEMDLPDEEINKICLQKADHEFKKLCREPLQKIAPKLTYAKISTKPTYRQTLSNLINLTQGLVARQWQGDLWIVFATAQRASAQSKIESSIRVGMKQYWKSLAASSSLVDWTLKGCLAVLHSDITSSWNFYDPENLLLHEDFEKKIMTLAQLVTPDDSELVSWFQDPGKIQGILGVAVVVVAGAAPAVAGIGLSLMFLKWITGVYDKTPQTLRCLMGYIVGLTLVMEQLFLNTLHLTRPFKLTTDHLEAALMDYQNSEAAKVHRAIREYANNTTFRKILNANNAEEKVIELIKQYQTSSV